MQAQAEAVLTAKRRLSRRIARRNGHIATKRATAVNALARVRAADPGAGRGAPLMWLDEVAAAATGKARQRWLDLLERYRVRSQFLFSLYTRSSHHHHVTELLRGQGLPRAPSVLCGCVP